MHTFNASSDKVHNKVHTLEMHITSTVVVFRFRGCSLPMLFLKDSFSQWTPRISYLKLPTAFSFFLKHKNNIFTHCIHNITLI